MNPVQIQQFVNRLVNQKDTGKQLNPKTVKNIHEVLHSALHWAVRIGYLKMNPASLTILPKRSKAEITPLQDEQVTQFLQAIKGHPFELVYLVDLFTGIRQSEILGLKWENVDFERGQITIFRQLQFLGHHLKHDLIYRHLKHIFKNMGIPKLRFHDLRYNYTVMSIQAGDDIKTVQESMGHYSAAFTLDVYGHVTEQMRRDSSSLYQQAGGQVRVRVKVRSILLELFG